MKIAVFLGGISTERNVSLASGKSVLFALQNLGHNVIAIDPAFGKNQKKNLIDEIPENISQFSFDINESKKFSPSSYHETIFSNLLYDIDLVFLTLHGKYGEDGTIQTLLELREKKFTGSNSFSSALAMDKHISKILFQKENILTPNWIQLEKNKNQNLENIKFPIVVKPNDGGSTIGMSIVKEENQLQNAIDLAFVHSNKILLEEYIEGQELTVSILENSPLPIIEIKPKKNFYDYTRKYTKGETEYICPAKIDNDLTQKIQLAALNAFNGLNCKTFARVDFRLRNDEKFFCLEVNTLPGMTSTSLVPKAAKSIGIDFESLCQKIIELSL